MPIFSILPGNSLSFFIKLSAKFFAASFAFSGNSFLNFSTFKITFANQVAIFIGNSLKKLTTPSTKSLPTFFALPGISAANFTICPKTCPITYPIFSGKFLKNSTIFSGNCLIFVFAFSNPLGNVFVKKSIIAFTTVPVVSFTLFQRFIQKLLNASDLFQRLTNAATKDPMIIINNPIGLATNPATTVNLLNTFITNDTIDITFDIIKSNGPIAATIAAIFTILSLVLSSKLFSQTTTSCIFSTTFLT